MVNILIANNNKIVAVGLKTILQSQKINRVSAIVNSYSQLASIANKNIIHIVVIDYNDVNFGLKSIKLLKDKFKKAKILAITNKLPKATIYNALQLGVDGYLLNDCDKPEILEAIQATIKGKKFYCGLVIDILSAQHDGEENDCNGKVLTDREIEIIRLISEGLTNKEIAETLFLSPHTVNTHRKNLMYKLGIKNTAGIVIYAVKENIITTQRKF